MGDSRHYRVPRIYLQGKVITTRRLYFGGKVIGGKLRNLSLEVSQQCLGGKSKVRGVSRIYLQVLEVKSLEVIYRQAYWRYFTSGRDASKRYWRCFHWWDRAAAFSKHHTKYWVHNARFVTLESSDRVIKLVGGRNSFYRQTPRWLRHIYCDDLLIMTSISITTIKQQ